MQIAAPRITTCLWFDTQAEEAANFYASVFTGSRIGRTSSPQRSGRLTPATCRGDKNETGT